MNFIVNLILFPIGFLIGIWYTSMLVLPIFYGIPKSLLGFFRGEIRFKATLMYLVAPVLWTLFFLVLFFLFATFWETGFQNLRENGAFNWGHVLGSWFLILNAIFNSKSRSDMRADFEAFVRPYKK